MLKTMLAAARAAIDVDLPGKNPSLASFFLEIIREQDPWLTATRRFRDLDELANGLPDDLRSAVGHLSPSLALAYQARIGAELALDVVYDREHRRHFPLITRGTQGGVFSDLGFYLKLSPEYLVLPCFHTHPDPRNDLGYEMPSASDYRVLEGLRHQLGGVGVCDRVVFPSGRRTLYGVDEHGCWFCQHPGRCRQHIARRDWLAVRPDHRSGKGSEPLG